MVRTIYVDIDGTLTWESHGFGEKVYANRSPKLEVIKVVNELFDRGCKIVLWTSRYEEDRSITVGWLKLYHVKYHELVFHKPKYDLFLDDKAMCPDNFTRITQFISEA